MEMSSVAEKSLCDVEIDLGSTQYCCEEAKSRGLSDSGLFLMAM